MSDSTLKCPRVVVGLDLGDKRTHVYAVDGETGEVLDDGKILTRPDVFESRFVGYSNSRFVLEAGCHSPWIYEVLVKLGHEVVLANPRRLQLITENDRKSDRVDAEMLAQLGRSAPDLLSPVWNRPSDTRGDLAQIRARDVFVQIRTKLVNHARALVKLFGGRLPKCSAASFHKLDLEGVPELARASLEPIVGSLADLVPRIKGFDKAIEELAEKKYPQTARLQQVHGVGPLTALAFVLTVGDPTRFANSRILGSFFGLRPRQSDSGANEPQLRITKGGNSYMRRLLVSSAQRILGPFGEDSDLRRWGLKLFERGGKNAKKRALVAVARKLAVLLHRLWITGEDYEPLRQANKQRRDVAVPPAQPRDDAPQIASSETPESVSTNVVGTHPNGRSQTPSPGNCDAPLDLGELPSSSPARSPRRLQRPNSADSNVHRAHEHELTNSANGSVASGLLRRGRAEPVVEPPRLSVPDAQSARVRRPTTTRRPIKKTPVARGEPCAKGGDRSRLSRSSTPGGRSHKVAPKAAGDV